MGLKKRLEHTHAQSAVIGISGGLDSTLAVLVTARAFDMLGIPRKNMICVTMPCYGTTDRTYTNAVTLIDRLGATLKEINIIKAVEQHFADIGHDPDEHNVVYENSQARERTQILMDLANKYNGMVIGTGDCQNLHSDGQRTTATICPCMRSILLFQRRWCAILFSIMRRRAVIRPLRMY